MTAINVIRQSRAVHVIADGANYSPTGETLFPSAKLWPLPHLSAVVALRGAMLLSPMIANTLGTVAESYDGLKLVIADALRVYLPQYIDMLRRHAEPAVFDLVVAGFSKRDGPDSFFICSHDRHPQMPAWTICPLLSVSMLPLDEELERECAAAFAGATSADDLDPDKDGLLMLELQRKRWFPFGADRNVRVRVGGFAQLMTVTEDLISSRILHRWPADRSRSE